MSDSSNQQAPQSPDSSPQSSTSATPAATSLQGGVRWTIPFGLGLVGCLLAWMLVEQYHNHFKLPEELLSDSAEALDPETAKLAEAESKIVDSKNMALITAFFGMALGGLLCLGLGLVKRSGSAVVAGLLTGLVLGAALGALGGWTAILVREELAAWTHNPTYQAMAAHATAWAIAGIGIGMATGLTARGLGGPNTGGTRVALKTTVGIAAAGLIAGVLYAPLSAALTILFPTIKSDFAIPRGTWDRLLWLALPVVLMNVALSRIITSSQPANTKASKPAEPNESPESSPSPATDRPAEPGKSEGPSDPA